MQFRYQAFVLGRVEVLIIIIPLLIVLLYIIKKKFIRSSKYYGKQKRLRVFVFVTRACILFLLLLALARPFIEKETSKKQTSKMVVLVDNSSSMKLFDLDPIIGSLDKLEAEELSISILNTGTRSNIADEILKNIGPGSSLLLISDGNNNGKTGMEEVLLFAASIHAKVFGVKLEPHLQDAAVTIEGPSKVFSDVENTFRVKMQKTSDFKIFLQVKIDGQVVYDKETMDSEIVIKKTFMKGVHLIRAEIKDQDGFTENNIFYKAVSVVKKPDLLLISKDDSPLEEILTRLYHLETRKSLPLNLDPYYAVILNDLGADWYTESIVQELKTYVQDGNGLFFIGGKHSFDFGDYNNSLVTSLLPVKIGKAKKKKEPANIVIALDTGVSGRDLVETNGRMVQFFDVQKAIALDVLDSLSEDSRVGVVESNLNPGVISPLTPLREKKKAIPDLVKRVGLHDTSRIDQGILMGTEMLRNQRGTKAIIIITDENLQVGIYYINIAMENVKKASNEGIRIFVIGVTGDEIADRIGRFDIEESIALLKDIAREGDGRFFHTDQSNRINIYFGNPDEKPKEGRYQLFTYDANHFITSAIEEPGIITGFNQVYPKSTARLLVTTINADPVLSVWQYGLGRTAALSTDDGSRWASSLVSPAHSDLLTRTVNWLVEDPERKNEQSITIPDLIANETAEIVVEADTVPEEGELHFFEEKNNVYKAYFLPQKTGTLTLFNQSIGVNYAREYRELGQNPRLQNLLEISGGSIVEDVTSLPDQTKREKEVKQLDKTALSWVFIVLAIVLYLLDVILRRVYYLHSSGGA